MTNVQKHKSATKSQNSRKYFIANGIQR